MAGSSSQWLLTTVNAVRELMIGRLQADSLDADSRRDVEMALEELDVMWEEMQGQAELLNRESRRYAEFFDYAPDAYVVTDAGGNIREANNAACELFGATREGLLRRPLGGYLVEADRTGFLSRFVGLLVENVDRGSWEANLQTASGRPIRALFTVRAIPLGKSGVGGLCWLIRPLD
ncbi:MAG TPA: PAS domain-containing protein [Burkholderiales bacterium]|jgi:PAS domain S-box-containing protein